MEPLAIDIKNLVVKKNGQVILHELSFAIPPGSVTGLIGPSGSGKTTLLRAIVGAQVVAGGNITVLGKPAGKPSLRARIGYVTQSPAVYPDITVEQNLRYFGAILGVKKETIASTLEAVGLTGQRKQLVSTLSGGQRARVSLAVALLGNPDVLILDEPTVGLDPLLRERLWKLFKTLAEKGKTLLVSSHVMDEAARCDRLLLLRDGEIMADAAPDELLHKTNSDNLEAAFIATIKQATAKEAAP